MGKLDGRCLCGKVTYTCGDAEPFAMAVCHCSECQRQAGTAFSTVVGVPRAALEIEGDSLAVFHTEATDSGGQTARHFCRECGSPIVSFSGVAPDAAFIKAGTLDDASWFEPQVQVWCGSAQPWVPLDGLAGAQLPRGPGG